MPKINNIFDIKRLVNIMQHYDFDVLMKGFTQITGEFKYGLSKIGNHRW